MHFAVQGEVQEVRQAHGPVVATDTIGNVDPTPASYTWKIKKKKKKKRHGTTSTTTTTALPGTCVA